LNGTEKNSSGTEKGMTVKEAGIKGATDSDRVGGGGGGLSSRLRTRFKGQYENGTVWTLEKKKVIIAKEVRRVLGAEGGGKSLLKKKSFGISLAGLFSEEDWSSGVHVLILNRVWYIPVVTKGKRSLS